MTGKLYIASYVVPLTTERHAFLIYDEDENDTDLDTNSNQVHILRGGAGINYGLSEFFETDLLIEVRSDATDSVDWDDLPNVTDFTLLTAAWSPMWEFAATMGSLHPSISEVYEADITYLLGGPNSNSVINTLLNVVGINFRDVIPTGSLASHFPGHMGLIDGSGDMTYVAYIYDEEPSKFYKRDGDDTILLEWNSYTDEHARLNVNNARESTGLTTVYFDGLNFQDVHFAGDTSYPFDLRVKDGDGMSAETLVTIEAFYENRSSAASEGAQTTAFEFEDLIYRRGDANNNTLDMSAAHKDVLFYGGEGDDTLDGGFGQDTVDYSAESGGNEIAVTDAGGGVLSVVDTYGDTDTLTNIERVVGASNDDTFELGSVAGRTFDGGAGYDTIAYDVDNTILDLRGGGVDFAIWNSTGTIHDTLLGIEEIEQVYPRSGKILVDADTDFEALPFASSMTDPVGFDDAPIALIYDTYFRTLDYSSVETGLHFDLRSRSGAGGSGPYTDGAGTYRAATVTGEGINHSFDHWATAIYGTNYGDTFDLHYFGGQYVYTGTGNDTVNMQDAAYQNKTIFYSGGDDTYNITTNLSQIILDGAVSLSDVYLIDVETDGDDLGFTASLGITGFGQIDLSYRTSVSVYEDVVVSLASGGAITFSNDYLGGGIFAGFAATFSGSSTVASVLHGNWGNNEWTGREGYGQTYYAYGGSDILDAGDGEDTLYGGDGDDRLIGGDDDDVLYGGDGADTAAFGGSLSRYEVTVLANSILVTDTVGQGGADEVSSDVEFVEIGGRKVSYAVLANQAGSAFDDFLIGTSGHDTLDGAAGADWINGGAGGDVLLGGLGNDRLWGSIGENTLDGGDGNDVLYIGNGEDTATGGDGSDLFVMQDGDSVTIADFDIGFDVIDLTNIVGVYGFSDLILVEDGDDTVVWLGEEWFAQQIKLEDVPYWNLSEYDFLFAEEPAGFNHRLPDVPTETLNGTASGDGLYVSYLPTLVHGYGGNDYISGAEENDHLYGDDGDDYIYGWTGNDLISGGDGEDFLAGEDGNDYYVMESADTYLDQIEEIGGTDYLIIPNEISTSDLVFYVSGDALTVANETVSNTWLGVFINTQFNGTGGEIEYIVVQDTVYELSDVALNGFPLSGDAFGGALPPQEKLNAFDDLVSTDEDTIVTGNVFDAHGNGADYDTNGLYLEVDPDDFVNGSEHFQLFSNGDFIYRPADNYFSGYMRGFVYTLRDADGNESEASVTFNILPVNDAPLTKADAVSGNEGSVITGNVLADNGSGADSDVEAEDLTVTAGTFTTAQGGSITLLANGDFSYTPAFQFYGVDTFTYTVTDESSASSQAVLTLTVNSIYTLIEGTSGNDALTGTSANERLLGLDGNDTLAGGTGNDVLNGGSGTNTASYASAGSGITANLSTGSATGEGTDVLIGIQNLIGSAYADTLTGDANANVFDGGLGNDTISGGDGTDTISFENDGNRVLIDLSDNLARQGWNGTTGTTLDALTGIENVVGSAYADRIIGNSGVNVIYGNAGNDVILGLEGDDTIYGGDGDDIIYGDDQGGSPSYNGGNDIVYGGAGNDTISTGADGDTAYGGDDNDSIWGGSETDYLYGDAGTDTLRGYEGDDILEGGAGNDTIYGDDQFNTTGFSGAGADIIRGDAGTDTLMGGDGNDTIYGGDDGDGLYGSAGADTLYGDAGNDTIYGDFNGVTAYDGNDILHGGAGTDTLIGGNGVDTLYGEDGFDSLWGQGGNDTFMFAGESAFNNVDRIRDFASGDKINIADVLSDYGYVSGTHSLSDWVTITTSGGVHNYVAVDRDGAGTTYTSFTNVVLVENFTTLSTSDLITV